ncbi:MAG: DUF1127 domain-containing protein [Hyphomicrobiaceae bacterium]|nr:DUF1127 domain-containing protein [Hyphomicrobiaceae bacterium]
MLDLYINANPHLRPHIVRAHRIRARTFSVLTRRLARALMPAELRRRIKCRRWRKKAVQELRSLSDFQLKDIGVSRSEILFKVTDTQPLECRG